VFGKPIAQATIDDLLRLISDGVAEGQRLEFKEAVPVSDEEQKKQRKTGTVRPIDEAVAKGAGIADFGRNALLEELVAFANADGGVIVLGMAETGDKPSRAAKLFPIPQVTALERRLRDALNSLIEPRLPFAAVRAIETETDGSGVVLIETERSSLGPHWVRPTRGAKIRREDRADPLSMSEIHDMVLRNARRFEDVIRKLTTSQAQFESYFFSKLRQMCKIPLSCDSTEQGFRHWAANNPRSRSFVGWRITIISHQDLGIERLEEMHDLIAGGCIDEYNGGERTRGHVLLYNHAFHPRRVLGGMTSTIESSERCYSLRVDRDGFVQLSFLTQSDVGRHVQLSTLLSGIGSALGSYECLRLKARAPSMPAEIGIEILSLPDRCPAIGDGFPETLGQPLDFKTQFPTATISERSSFDSLLNEVSADLANAGDLHSSSLPRFGLTLTIPQQRAGS
jgi:hypothetical protein